MASIPVDKTIVKSKWVYTHKPEKEDETKWKARLVAKGYSQKEGDYKETVAPVISMDVLRLTWALSHEEERDMYQILISRVHTSMLISRKRSTSR